MPYIYSDPTRETEEHALPDTDVFYVSDTEAALEQAALDKFEEFGEESDEYTMLLTAAGWYWWACFPGCLPDGNPNGPFATEAEATANAQDIN